MIDVKTPKQLFSLIDNNEAILLDVRELDEWDEGHLPEAIHHPLSEILKGNVDLPKEKPLYLYCRSGGRVIRACEILTKFQFCVFPLVWGYEELNRYRQEAKKENP